MKTEFFSNGVMGYESLREKSLLPDLKRLTKTHVFVNLLEARNPEDVYFKMQGESWSPTSDARVFVASKGVLHTTMSVGDIAVDYNSRAGFILDQIGFRFLGTVTTLGEY
jgi:hypothetical protein